MGTEQYGQYYWCIKVPESVSPEGEIYVMADAIKTDAVGSLWMIGKNERVNLILAVDKWIAVYAASLLDGSAVAVERWVGEVER